MKEVQVPFVSAARTATSTATFNAASEGCLIFINVTAAVSSPSVVFTVKGYDPVSGTAYTILTSAAITGAGLTVLRIHPDLSAAANTIAKDVLPQQIGITATHGNTDSITYSVSFIGVEC